MPIYTSYYCIHDKVSKGWTYPECVVWKHGYKSFIVDGYVNKVILTVEIHSCPQGAGDWSEYTIRFNGKEVIHASSGPPATWSADVTNLFMPRRTEDGEQADELKIGFAHFWAPAPAEWEVTAYLSIDVTGTLTETTSTAFTKTPETELAEALGVFIPIMFMMMFMSMFMSILSSFREAM